MKKTNKKLGILLGVTFLIGSFSSLPTAYASEEIIENTVQKKTTKVIGSFQSTVIDVQIPAIASFLYNPNTREMTPQVMGIANSSNAPVSMKLQSINISNISTWKPELVAPTLYTDNEWNNLTQAKTKSEVALGLEVMEDDDWLRGIENKELWSTDLHTELEMGAIKSHSEVEALPTLKAGTSLTTEEILTANYIFEFSLK